MADNTELNTGSGGDTIASDDIGGVKHQRVKVQYGVDGAATDVSDTNPLPIDDAGGSLTVDSAVLDSIQTAVEIIDNAISGSEMQVDVVAALPAGTNAIGKLAANSGVDIGDVDVTTVVPGTGASNLGKAEDAAHTTGDVGVMGLAVRRDADTSLSGTDGDYTPLQVNATGALKVEVFDGGDSHTVDNADITTIAGAVSGSEMQVDVVAALPAGTNAIGKLASNSGVDIGDVDVTSISAGSNLVGDVGISGARTSGGTTFYRNIDVDETEDAVKTSAGQIYFIQCTNLDATPIYLQLYNATVASVTVGTTTADLTFCVPSQGDANGAGFVLAIPNGIAFGTAITVAATTTAAGSGGPAANKVILNIGYA